MSRWFRMYDDLINDPKVQRLSGDAFKAWVNVLCAASKNEGQVPPAGDLAFMLRLSEFEVGDILAGFVSAGLVDDVDGVLCPHNWDGRQYKSDTSTDRVKKFRDKNKAVTGNVSGNGDGNVSVTPPEQNRAEQITEQNSRSKDRPTSAQIDLEEAIAAKAPKPAKPASRFDAFWTEYPRRDGPNPRKPAEQRFDALVKSGLDPEFLIAEVRKFNGAETTRGNVGTRFIPQAATWLNQQRWSDHAAVAAIAEMAGIEMHIESAVKMFAKARYWSKHAGPEPGQIGCKASAELLAKYGLAPDGLRLPDFSTETVQQPQIPLPRLMQITPS